MECMLPEIINPQYPKRLLKSDIKEPLRIMEEIEKRKHTEL